MIFQGDVYHSTCYIMEVEALSDHYYSAKPTAISNPHIIEETIKDKVLRFYTDVGVFSKKQIDFGSRLLIESVELEKHKDVLDIGCGYGPIGLFAAKMATEGHVTLVDINERAVELCRKNAELNRIRNVDVLQSNLFERLEGRFFDDILSNPPIRAGKKVVHHIFEGAAQHLKSGGCLWIVIQKKQGASSALQKLCELYEDVIEVTKSKGYRIFKATKA